MATALSARAQMEIGGCMYASSHVDIDINKIIKITYI